MQYTEKQVDEFLQAYFRSNSDAIKDYLRFLMELHEDEDRIILPDIWYCFEATRHKYAGWIPKTGESVE